MKSFWLKCANGLNYFQWLPLLLFRLTLSYGFFMPAVHKFQHYEATVKWFASAGFPYPHFLVALTGGFEILGSILLFLGLCTRLISIPLIFIMCVAIFSVHWQYGFSAANNGFEIPFYYAVMLLGLLFIGPGKVSIDGWIKKALSK